MYLPQFFPFLPSLQIGLLFLVMFYVINTNIIYVVIINNYNNSIIVYVKVYIYISYKIT